MTVEYSITIVLMGCLIIGYTLKHWNTDQVVFPIRTKGHKIYKTQYEKFMKVKNVSSISLGLLFLTAGLISFRGNKESIMVSLLALGVAMTAISEMVLKKCIDLSHRNKGKNNTKGSKKK